MRPSLPRMYRVLACVLLSATLTVAAVDFPAKPKYPKLPSETPI